MSQDTPSRGLDKIIVRLPDGMRGRLKESADANGRSVNAEVVHRLQASFPQRYAFEAEPGTFNVTGGDVSFSPPAEAIEAEAILASVKELIERANALLAIAQKKADAE